MSRPDSSTNVRIVSPPAKAPSSSSTDIPRNSAIAAFRVSLFLKPGPLPRPGQGGRPTSDLEPKRSGSVSPWAKVIVAPASTTKATSTETYIATLLCFSIVITSVSMCPPRIVLIIKSFLDFLYRAHRIAKDCSELIKD